MDEQKVIAEIEKQAETMTAPEMRAHMLAFAECGYMVTEMNQHTFSAREVEAYLDGRPAHDLIAFNSRWPRRVGSR
ncbi:hypothetical protein GCM10010191_88620 [Actinomadura vinacea]|uniref:Uncharacterized protein n=1 Tax=Actinomadura vinacea TaxID=115336 RepID=A0ABN3KC76_9ACTN